MSATRKILVVEDEEVLADILSDYLKADDFDTAVMNTGIGVVEEVRNNPPDLLLLDLMLPGVDGLTICQKIREFSELPIIMVTAKVDEAYCLQGLEMGADDYICKPVKPREVVARVKTVLRRITAKPSELGNKLVINNDRHCALWQGQPIKLTPVEFGILSLLLKNTDRVYSRDMLMNVMYDDGRYVSTRTIDVHVKNLRKKLALVTAIENPIRSVYGVGYKIDLY